MFKSAHRDDDSGSPRYAGLTGRWLSTAVSVIATCGFLLFGYDQGVMSGIISAEPFNNYFPQTKGDSTWQGFVTAIYEVGCLFGAVFALVFGDTFGRRRLIILGGCIMIVGTIIQVTPFQGHNQTAQFIIGRTITGLGNGINTSTIPSYQAECSKTKNRGLLICIEGGIIAFGTLIAYWIDYGCSYGSADLSWRFPIAFQIIFGLILSISMFFLPESPRYLMSIGKKDEAVTVLAALRGLPRQSDEIQLQAGIIVDSIKASGVKNGHTPFSALFTGGKTQHFRRAMLGVSSQLFQQIGGCNAVIYYAPILIETTVAPGNHNLALLIGGFNAIVYAVFATSSWFVIERVGRRKLFFIGTIGQSLSMVLVFAALIPGDSNAAKGATVGLFTYIAFFGASWLPLPWLYPAEINPITTRAKANALSTCTNWLFNFLIVMITPVMITNIGWGTYLFFAVVNACFLPFIYFFYPETAGRSLEEIDLIFAKGYVEHMSYVKAAKELPRLSDEEIDAKAREYGFNSSDNEAGQIETRFGEKEGDLAVTQGGQMG